MKRVRQIDDKWYIETDTDEFGKVLLLNKDTNAPIPVYFNTEQEALKYIKVVDQGV